MRGIRVEGLNWAYSMRGTRLEGQARGTRLEGLRWAYSMRGTRVEGLKPAYSMREPG